MVGITQDIFFCQHDVHRLVAALDHGGIFVDGVLQFVQVFVKFRLARFGTDGVNLGVSDIDRPGIVEFESEIGHVKMIPFKGSVNSEIFTGIIEPCGVDTQVTNQNQVRHMSARYMLTGKDQDDADCHIYVENNAWFTNGEQPKPFRTVPTFITDSKRLASYLHCNRFVGEGFRDERGLWIRFYELKESE